MATVHRAELEVRGYELDSFGHVNHSVYLNYLEHARWRMLYEAGITLEKLQQWKRWPVIAKIEVEYLKPTFLGERLIVHSHVTSQRKTSFIVEQTITRDEQLVLKARIHAVMVNEKGRPAEMPSEVSQLGRE